MAAPREPFYVRNCNHVYGLCGRELGPTGRAWWGDTCWVTFVIAFVTLFVMALALAAIFGPAWHSPPLPAVCTDLASRLYDISRICNTCCSNISAG